MVIVQYYTAQLYTFKWLILHYVNFASIKKQKDLMISSIGFTLICDSSWAWFLLTLDDFFPVNPFPLFGNTFKTLGSGPVVAYVIWLQNLKECFPHVMS